MLGFPWLFTVFCLSFKFPDKINKLSDGLKPRYTWKPSDELQIIVTIIIIIIIIIFQNVTKPTTNH